MTHTAKTTVVELLRISWPTVGAIVTRVVADGRAVRDPFDALVRIGIDEISYKRGHKYILVTWNQAAGLNKPSVSHELRKRSMRLANGTGGRGPSAETSGRPSGCGIWADLGRSPRTIDVYACGLAEHLRASRSATASTPSLPVGRRSQPSSGG